MSMINIHRSALESISEPYHIFLSSQKKYKKKLYGFVEGKTDPAFYFHHIYSLIPDDSWEISLIEAGSPGNKENVLNLFNLIDWNRYSPKQTVFFVDRDFNDFFNDPRLNQKNVYITDNYSIENDIVNPFTLKRIVRELYNLNLVEYEFDILKESFLDGIKIISSVVQIISCYYILLKLDNKKPSFDNINFKELCQISNCQVKTKSETDIHQYVQTKWSSNYSSEEYQFIESLFSLINKNGRCIRGKFLMWYFIGFLNSLTSCCHELFPRIENPMGSRPLAESTAIIDLAPRSSLPYSLKEFIEYTYLDYISINNC